MLNEQLATIQQILPLAFAGALLADHLGFYLGYLAGPGLHETGFAKRHRSRLERVEHIIQRFGWGAILIGRFIPAIRSVLPAVTGLSGFDRGRYTFIDAMACALWALGLGLILTGVESLL